MLWTPEEGYFLLEKHLARMRDSAGYFDFPFPEETIQSRLDAMAAGFGSPQRVRLLLDRSGALSTEAAPFRAQTTPFKVCLAKEPVSSQNIFLYHKTTRREIYDNALAVPQIYNDVLLYNEENELTEFTIGNLVIELNGELVTPPISCGLLAGTFRAHLLETGQVRERVIKRDELTNSQRVFMVNSLRKWVEVNLK
jgi:para-aminobenzoate synthetase/4-amino-4-deoxychorismate lyase